MKDISERVYVRLLWLTLVMGSIVFIYALQKHSSQLRNLRIVQFDGCEYVENGHGALTHKGNCNNPIHRK